MLNEHCSYTLTLNCNIVDYRSGLVGGFGWVRKVEWLVGQWIVGVISFQKIFVLSKTSYCGERVG